MNNQKGFVIPLIIIIVAILVIGGGVFVYQKKVVQKKAVAPIGAMQPTIIYKTNGDYYYLVPVTLNDDKTKIMAYPDVRGVYFRGELAYPTKLNYGYLLDNRGVTKNSAFLKYTYDEYSKLAETPKSDELFSSVIIVNPFIEMYDCGNRSFNKDTEHLDINDQIINSQQLKRCKKII